MRRAYHAMRSGKGGPVLVEIPDEVLRGRVSRASSTTRRCRCSARRPIPTRSRGARRCCSRRRTRCCWAGQGVLYARGERPARGAGRARAGAGRHHQSRARARSPRAIRCALGASTRSRPKMFTDFMAKADLVLAIGSSLTKTPFGPSVPPGKTIIHSTNDAGDINKEYRVDHARGRRRRAGARCADRGSRPAEGARGGGNALASLKEEVAAAKKAWLAEWAKHLDSDETPINQYRVIRDLMRTVDRDNVIITHDSGSPREQLMPFWETTRARLLHGLGQVDPARLRARHHHGRQARRARQALRQRHGRRRHRHDRHGHRDRRAQPHRDPHRRVQQRRHGGRARRAEDLRPRNTAR